MGLAVRVPDIGVAAWRSWLRGIWDSASAPGPASAYQAALAVLAVTSEMRVRAHELLAEISQDVYIRRGIESAVKDLRALDGRFAVYFREMARAKDAASWDDAAAIVRAYVVRPLLDGVWPADFDWSTGDASIGTGESSRRGLVESKLPGAGWSGMPDAALVAIVWNQLAQAWAEDHPPDEGWTARTLRELLTAGAREFEASAPGEEPTARDHLVRLLEDAAANTARLVAAAATATGLTTVLYVGAAVLGVALLVYVARR